jgi:6-phosphogluconolactonase
MPPQRSRRHFLAASATLPLALRSYAATLTPSWLVLGTDKGKGFYRAPWNATTGEIGPSELILEATRPAFFATHPTLPILYSANEAATGDGNISALRLNHATGDVHLINTISARSPGSCYISIDRTGRLAFVANYGGGSLTTLSLNSDGSLSSQPPALYGCKTHPCGTPGPNAARQDAPHFHCATVSPDNAYVLVCDLGTDAIEIFPISPGQIQPPQRIPTRPGSGPRHVAFHPNGRWLYVVHELDCTLELFDWNPRADTKLTPRKDSVISTLATRDHLPGSTACELVISPDGRFLYANTRGEDSLTVYRIDRTTGLLTEQQRVATQGKVTRLIAFDPTRRWLLCMNQGSSTISVFSHDPHTGTLSKTPKLFPAETPMCVEWI